MRPALVTFATLLLLWTLVNAANQALAGFPVSLFVGGLYVTYAAVALPPAAGGTVVFLAGLVCDANTGMPFGTEALLFLALQVALVQTRDRLPQDDPVGRVGIALVGNLVLFLAVALLRARHEPVPSVYWTRASVDLIASEAVVLLAGPWFFTLQAAALEKAGGRAFRRS